MRQKLQFIAVFTRTIQFLSVAPLFCHSCQNDFEAFKEILQTRQKPGRVRRRIVPTISSQVVVTKMACLDQCLRTTQCGSFDVKRRPRGNNGRRFWVCIINRQANNFLSLTGVHSRWIHANISSQELQEVR